MNQAVLIFSGFNTRAVVAFCRSATRLNVPFHILASSEQDPILMTPYASSVYLTRENLSLEPAAVIGWIEGIRKANHYDRLVVLPTSEFLNRFLLENRAALENAGCYVPLASMELYKQVSGKQSFAELCSQFGLAAPQEFNTMPTKVPFVAKPRRYASTRTGKQLKPWLLTSAELVERFRQCEIPDDFFFQEMATGRSVYLLYYVSRTDQDVLYSQENLMQQCNGGSIIIARRSTSHEQPIAQQYLKMFKELGYWGVLMLELKDTPEGYVMIEANPRFWGPFQFVIDNRVPILDQFLIECGFELEPAIDSSEPGDIPYYFWSGGMTHASQPLAFHNYCEQQFLADYPDLIRSDVYLRDDSLQIYSSEIRRQ